MLPSPLITTSPDGENYTLKSMSREGAKMLWRQLEPVHQAERAFDMWQKGWQDSVEQGGVAPHCTDSPEFARD